MLERNESRHREPISALGSVRVVNTRESGKAIQNTQQNARKRGEGQVEGYTPASEFVVALFSPGEKQETAEAHSSMSLRGLHNGGAPHSSSSKLVRGPIQRE